MGNKAGRTILIPRITHVTQENGFSFKKKKKKKEKKKEVSYRTSSAVTINKSQAQTFSKIGVYFLKNFFSHGQLYVSTSGVEKKEEDNIKFMTPISN